MGFWKGLIAGIMGKQPAPSEPAAADKEGNGLPDSDHECQEPQTAYSQVQEQDPIAAKQAFWVPSNNVDMTQAVDELMAVWKQMGVEVIPIFQEIAADEKLDGAKSTAFIGGFPDRFANAMFAEYLRCTSIGSDFDHKVYQLEYARTEFINMSKTCSGDTPTQAAGHAPEREVKPKTSPARPRKVIDRFVALDVETANNERHSICQIGVVLFEKGREVAAEKVMVDPRQDFGQTQIRIHGIEPHHVAGQPCFAEHHAWLSRWIAGQHVVSHTFFDNEAITQACQFHGVPGIAARWHDSCEAARSAWPHLANHKLGTLAEAFGISYAAHDALADARVAGQLFYHAKAGTPYEQIRELLRTEPAHVGEGPLSGHCVTFTNSFDRPESQLRQLAMAAGATFSERISKKNTTLLVVGAHGRREEWGEKSRAQLTAEEAIAAGRPMRIISEAELLQMVAQT